MDKWIGGNPKSQWESDKWHERAFLFTSIQTNLVYEGKEERERPNEKEREKRGILEREALPSLLNSRRSDRRFPARQEAKLLPTARAKCGYRFWGVSTNSGR